MLLKGFCHQTVRRFECIARLQTRPNVSHGKKAQRYVSLIFNRDSFKWLISVKLHLKEWAYTGEHVVVRHVFSMNTLSMFVYIRCIHASGSFHQGQKVHPHGRISTLYLWWNLLTVASVKMTPEHVAVCVVS